MIRGLLVASVAGIVAKLWSWWDSLQADGLPWWVNLPMALVVLGAGFYALSKMSGTWDDADSLGGYPP